MCTNHITTNIRQRLYKLLMSELKRRIQRSQMRIPQKTPLRWLAEHLLGEIERNGNDATFTLTDKLRKKFDDLKYGNLPALMDLCKDSFASMKSFLPVGHRLADVESEWVHWIPVTYRILQLFETYAAEWKSILEARETYDEKAKLARTDFRGGPLVKPFPFLPICKNKVSCCSLFLPLKLYSPKRTLILSLSF